MEFSIAPIGPQWYGKVVFEKFNGIFATGPIEEGDAEKFARIIPSAGRDMYGNIALAISSPGGSVIEAFKIVDIMDREEVSVYVPGNARCASACASIIYLSGRFHTLLDEGAIGFHTCVAETGVGFHPSSFCNKKIIDNAVDHGTDYAPMEYFMDPKAVKELHRDDLGIVWLGADTACTRFRMCGPADRDEQGLAIPSFKCETAKLPSERAICSNRQLARYDYLIAKLYSKIRNRSQDEKEPLRKTQIAFLEKRDGCADDARCMRDRMKERYEELLRLDLTFLIGQGPGDNPELYVRRLRKLSNNRAMIMDSSGPDRQRCGDSDPDLSISSCTAIIQSGKETRKKLAVTYHNRGIAYGNKGQYDRAIADFDQAIRLNPNDADFFRNRGSVYADKKQYDRAIEDFSQAIRLNPNDIAAFVNRGGTYVNKGRFDLAIRDYDQGIRLDQMHTSAFYGRGVAYLMNKEYGHAIEDFGQTVRLDPSFAAAYFARGVAFGALGRKTEAAADFDKARKLDPNLPPQ
jgi:tetratricopeptide (TPR) repeat protein